MTESDIKGFYIIGFETFPYISVYIIFLAFVYVVTLVFNILLIYIIARDHCLHTPKFLAVVNLAVIDIMLNTSTIPSMLKTFLFMDNFVPFNICVTWVYSLGRVAYSTAIMTHLSFCSSVRVYSYFCDYAPVFRLACNDYTLQWSVASASSMVNLMAPFTFIILTYISILITVFRMKSVSSRMKALATCIEHIVLVAVFYIPIFSIFLIGLYVRAIDPDQRVLSLSLASCIPPCINPIVYSLKTNNLNLALKLYSHKRQFA
ncbi:olfactory receptor 1F1-like [Sander lucioperca]|uniref:olfactory receptor 1F1-like n=1 Tax=Sander lucioperca TaxID=283035 RepID=UPI001653ACEE|nr:olfactory receptor 1F1-like [Sander lucioperca]